MVRSQQLFFLFYSCQSQIATNVSYSTSHVHSHQRHAFCINKAFQVIICLNNVKKQLIALYNYHHHHHHTRHLHLSYKHKQNPCTNTSLHSPYKTPGWISGGTENKTKSGFIYVVRPIVVGLNNCNSEHLLYMIKVKTFSCPLDVLISPTLLSLPNTNTHTHSADTDSTSQTAQRHPFFQITVTILHNWKSEKSGGWVGL